MKKSKKLNYNGLDMSGQLYDKTQNKKTIEEIVFDDNGNIVSFTSQYIRARNKLDVFKNYIKGAAKEANVNTTKMEKILKDWECGVKDRIIFLSIGQKAFYELINGDTHENNASCANYPR